MSEYLRNYQINGFTPHENAFMAQFVDGIELPTELSQIAHNMFILILPRESRIRYFNALWTLIIEIYNESITEATVLTYRSDINGYNTIIDQVVSDIPEQLQELCHEYVRLLYLDADNRGINLSAYNNPAE